MRGLRGVHGEAGQPGKPGNDGLPGVQGLQVRFFSENIPNYMSVIEDGANEKKHFRAHLVQQGHKVSKDLRAPLENRVLLELQVEMAKKASRDCKGFKACLVLLACR